MNIRIGARHLPTVQYVVKKNGKLRMCLDPRKLKRALKRCFSRIPAVEEITPSFVGSVYLLNLMQKLGIGVFN